MTPPVRRPLVLSLAAAALVLAAACGDSRGPGGPNIVLVTLDTTRADHLGCYGYERDTSPAIDRLAADALRYENAYAVTSWTLPAHASLFTGKFPSAHGARYTPRGKINLVQDGGIKGNPAWSAYRANTIAANEITLAQVLYAQGYATHGIIGGPWMKKTFGLDKGFEGYDDSNFQMQGGSEPNGRTAADITRAAIEFVDAHADESFFLFLNYYDPHSPYNPSEDYLRRFWKEPYPQPGTTSWKWTLALYDAEIRYTDDHFGVFLDHLRKQGLYEDAWIILTADHGELMGELDEEGNHLQGHGNSLSQAEIHIPLIVKEPGPDRPRGVSDVFVQQIDVMPTLLKRLGLALPPNVQGRSITSTEHPIAAEVYPHEFMTRNNAWRQQGDWKVLVEGRWKFVQGGLGRHLLFDLENDPEETRNVISAQPEVAAAMEQRLEELFAALPAPGEALDVDVTPEDLQRLEDAGYIGGDEGD